MNNISDQLKRLPEEFVTEMELQKEERWNDVYEFVIDYFNCRNEITKAEREGFPFKPFLKMIHDMGFYGGVNFALDPAEPYYNENKQLY